MLCALPFRCFAMFTCEHGSGFYWRIWAAEQIAQIAVLVSIAHYIESLT
jgi:hypothetical protein